MNKIKELTASLKKLNIDFSLGKPLAPYTTWKIGGPAEILAEISDKNTLHKVLELVNKLDIPLTILGSGSNVLISDEGIKGLVIINRVEYLFIGNEDISSSATSIADKIQARLDQVDIKEYYSFEDIDYDESTAPTVSVTVSSGFYLPKLINATINKGVTGLQWFAGIPGTVGGAVYNNIHGGTYFLSDFIEEVKVIDKKGIIKNLQNKDLHFDYDNSYFHSSDDIILEVKLNLYKGDAERALRSAIAWAQKKRIQPYNSAGCCFKNISAIEMEKHKLLSSSWGYIIDKILSLKGIRVGDAVISTKHAAFIENVGKAKASDVIALFDLIYTSSENKLGIRPRTEIFMLGFPKEVTSRYV